MVLSRSLAGRGADLPLSAAVHAAGTDPYDDPPGAEQGYNAVQTVVGSAVLLHQNYHSVSHGSTGSSVQVHTSINY